MFNIKDFYPTPAHVLDLMLEGENITDKICYEPEAGKGDVVDRLWAFGAGDVLASENNPDLRKILTGKCKLIGDDFLKVEAHQISHINYIFMNPPFSADEAHINHAFDIAPDGCKIVALCNAQTLKNDFSRGRKKLKGIVDNHGYFTVLENSFIDSERSTGVEIALIKMIKPGASYENEFSGFIMDDEPEEQGSGIMQYNVIRDLVNRYIASIKIFDKQLEAAVEMNGLTEGFFNCNVGLNISSGDKQMTRTEFKKEMQKSAWNFIFKKLNMDKYTTKGLKKEINKFVETQENVPFTMHNVYHMLRLIVGTHAERMDKALLEVFNKVTEHYDENRFNVEGWKTNSHYLINEKFILGYITVVTWGGNLEIKYGSNDELMNDFQKALCYIMGENYDNYESLYSFFNHKKVPGNVYPHEYVKYEFGTWYDWGFFQVRGYKKGSMHFKFKDRDVWAKFNQHIARLKGYPLYEATKKTEKAPKKSANFTEKPYKEAKIIAKIKVS